MPPVCHADVERPGANTSRRINAPPSARRTSHLCSRATASNFHRDTRAKSSIQSYTAESQGKMKLLSILSRMEPVFGSSSRLSLFVFFPLWILPINDGNLSLRSHARETPASPTEKTPGKGKPSSRESSFLVLCSLGSRPKQSAPQPSISSPTSKLRVDWLTDLAPYFSWTTDRPTGHARHPQKEDLHSRPE